MEATRGDGAHDLYEAIGRLVPGVARDVRASVDAVAQEIAPAGDEALAGLRRVASIMAALEYLAAASAAPCIDVNDALSQVLTVTHNAYKFVADVEVEFGSVPPVPGGPDTLLAVLMLVVDASNTVADAVNGSERRGTIRFRTWYDRARCEAVVDASFTCARDGALATRCLRRRAR